MTAKKAKAPKVEDIGNSDSAPTFDSKSAEVADVAQGEDEKQDPATVGQKVSEMGTGMPPVHPEQRTKVDLTANLKKLEDTVVSRQIGFSEDLRRLEELVGRSAPAELEEKIAEVSSKHGQSIAELGQELKARVVEHHDRLLELEMKVTGLTEGGKDEEQPG